MDFVTYALHLTLPRHSNNFRARVLHPSGIVVLALLLAVFQLWVNFAPKPAGLTLGYAANIPPAEVVQLTNVKRAQNGLEPVRINQNLSLAARRKGEHMLANNYWAHVSPDGTEPWKFFRDVGYGYRFAGENLARDFTNPASAVEAWMASPSHRDNMLSDRYSEIGVAVVEGDLNGKDTTIVVQLFGRPAGQVVPSVPVAEAAPAAEAEPVPQPEIQPALSPDRPAFEEKVVVEPPPEAPQVSPLGATKAVSLVVAGAILVTLIADEALVVKRGVERMRGRVFAHVSFFAMILAIIVVIRSGSVL